ncbi:MAG: hypothetical protein LUC47_02095, partial [Clostridiales bacterium]|nr:hypothetical protein [Clostridiales bacterium]
NLGPGALPDPNIYYRTQKEPPDFRPAAFFFGRKRERKERRKNEKQLVQFALPCSLAASIE